MSIRSVVCRCRVSTDYLCRCDRMADAGLAARVLRRCVADLVRKARVRASLGVGRSAALVAGRLGQAVWSGVLYTLYRVVGWPVVGPETRPVPVPVPAPVPVPVRYRSRRV